MILFSILSNNIREKNMLRFILGKSGTGKTTFIYDKIKELVHSGNKKIIMLVPDQSSFETEKDFLNLLGSKCSKNVLVVGFSKLCRYVFEMTGNLPENVLDDGTRGVIMNIALEQLTEKLSLFKSKNNKGVCDVLLQTLSDCKKNNISTNALRMSAEKVSDGTLKTKLNETALVLDTFDAIIAQSYIDPLDDLTRLSDILLENNIFEGYTLFVDSFSGFTSQQLKVLRAMLSQCFETYISLTLDPNSDCEEDVFSTSIKTYKTIKNLAKKDNINIKTPIRLNELKRFANKELNYLEEGVFRKNTEKYFDNPKNITLYTADDTYNECEYVARQIKNLVVNEGYLYSDITVISHDIEPYDGILNVMFDKYEIPYFMDCKKDIEVKPVIRFVMSFFRSIINDFDREDLIALLKTGLTQNTEKDINAFENYIYIWNINNSDFKNEFKQNPRGFSDDFTDNDLEILATSEKVRKSIVEPILSFKSAAKDKNGREITELLYSVFTNMGVQDALNKLYDILESGEEKGLGAEQIRIWNMFVDILDKMVAVVGETPITIKRYFELLSIQIASIELSQIPQTIDSVNVTSAQRVRLSKQRASFLIGCSEGVFPSIPHNTGVFSTFELKILSLNDLTISDDFASLTNLETFMSYCCINSPSERLYVSYPLSDMLGNVNNPSVIIGEITKIFPDLIALDSIDFNSPEHSFWAIQPAFEYYAKSLKRNVKGNSNLRSIFEQNQEYAVKIDALERAIDNSPFKIQNSDNTHMLFGNGLKISASQIEKFNLCRFSYFCNYGLRIRERRKAEINPMEYGTLVHYILEKFFSKFEKSEYSKMKDDKILDFIDDILNDYTDTYFGGTESKSGAFLYRVNVIKENVFILLKHMITELAQSDFDVVDCELNIGKDVPAYTIKLPTGESVAVFGSIDRVDIMEKDDVKYLRIVDYKTGSKEFRLSDILYGLNLQMLLYLSSVKSNSVQKYGETTPAGILYMPAASPNISADKTTTADKIEYELDKAFRMNGLLLNDLEVIKGMDKSENARYIPVKIKLDTAISDRSLATLEEFGKIFNKLDLTVAEMGKELYNGNIEASPTIGSHKACEYCPYDSVCAYHMSEPRNTFDVDNKAVFEEIDKEICSKNSDDNMGV